MTMRMVWICVMVAVSSTQVWAAESGFLDDYSILEKRAGDSINRVYIAPNAMDLLAGYDSLMVDRPEVLLADDTKYKGAKPEDLLALSEASRDTFTEQFEAGGYSSVEEPGAGVIYMRWAITDLYLKKKKRKLLAYTPTGFLVNAARQATIKDVWRKIDIVELSVEAEFLDSKSGALLAAVTMERGARKTKESKQELVSWEDLDASMRTFGARLVCNLDNAHKSSNEREDCIQIEIEVAPES